MKRLAFIIPIVFLISLFFPRCAVIVSPTGGPKDTIAPVLVRSVPTINSTNFKGKKVVITFDEYIRLDKIGEKLVLSPPQERLPDFKIKGKSLEIEFFEPLKENTTYTLYFDDAIVDNNEGNKLQNFEFALSTGPIIDSLRFTGRVIDALTLEPQQGTFVMLYDRIEDSIPLLEMPRYVTKTDKAGRFFLSNLNYDNYKIFALRDENSNYKFDQITEAIAFRLEPIDSFMLIRPSDLTQLKDSSFVLRLFQEENRVLSRTDFNRNQRRKITLGFTRRPEGEVALQPINAQVDSAENWYEIGTSLKGDSIDFWILNDEISKIDTLIVCATYLKTDSLFNLVEAIDTLRAFYVDKAQPASTRRRKPDSDETVVKPSFSVKPSISAGANVLPNEPMRLTFTMPLLKRDTTLVSLMNMTDSTLIPSFTFSRDSLNPTLYSAQYEWQSNINYRLTAFPEAFTNLDGVSNDTLTYNFKGADPEKFGTISLNITGTTPNVIVELTKDKGVVVDTKTVDKDGIVKFNYVAAGKYKMRFILDENRNGKWDTGFYLKGIQPEKIVLYEDKDKNNEIQVRANWEYEISFNLEQIK